MSAAVVLSMLRHFLVIILLAGSAAVSAKASSNASVGAAVDIVVMGDSLSAAHNIPEPRGWVNLLRRRLAEEGVEGRVINVSVSGATTAAGLQILPAALKEHAPDIVILELGANDGLQGKPLAYITANLRRLIEMSRDAGARVLLVGNHLPPNYGPAYTEPFFEQYATLAENYQLAYIPFMLEGVAGREALMQADRLHPTAEAQPRVLETIWPVLQSLLENPGDHQPENQKKAEKAQ